MEFTFLQIKLGEIGDSLNLDDISLAFENLSGEIDSMISSKKQGAYNDRVIGRPAGLRI